MKFFLLILGTLLASGGLAALSYASYTRIGRAKTSLGRTIMRLVSALAAIASVLTFLYIVETQTAPVATSKPNPIDVLNQRAAEESKKVERPVLESKTHREYVREATQQ